ncbi:hypothetical protein AOQ73_11955 [Bradyrhizobium pachyrhizi]|nr:hypothetical protein AOQ73_11955 [Bradyrhizobium pachyrhizi]
MSIQDEAGEVVSIGRNQFLGQEGLERQIGERHLAASRSTETSAPMPASWSSDRSGVTLAIRCLRSAKPTFLRWLSCRA